MTWTTIKEKIGLNASTLKWIAIVFMFLNHLCCSLGEHGVSNYFVTDAHWYLTRISFIIFAFQIGEGFHYTHNKGKYILYIFVFALLTEIPFDLCFSNKVFMPGNQNVLFTLGFGALCLLGIDHFDRKPLPTIVITLTAMVICTWLSTDYGALGIVTIVSFYYFRDVKWKQLLFTLIIFTIINLTDYWHGMMSDGTGFVEAISSKELWDSFILEQHALAAWPLLMLYNGKKGRNVNKWFFYGFYPGHLLLIYLLSLIIF